MTGSWCGRAGIHNAGVVARGLDVHVTIAPDGSVHGTVGDATLADARLRRNRGAVERALKLKTDWIIEGGLVGPLVAAEGIERATVTMPLDRVDEDPDRGLRGGVHTSGWPIGGAESVAIVASGLVLRRCPRPPS